LHSPILAPLIALVLWSFVMWAWLYVGLRIAHSLVQAAINVIILRFSIERHTIIQATPASIAATIWVAEIDERLP
jgi:hypothetical protein